MLRKREAKISRKGKEREYSDFPREQMSELKFKNE